MKNKKVIFITGTSYSGSTMLDMILSNDNEIFSLGEVNALFRPYRKHHLEQIQIEKNKDSVLYKSFLKGENELYQTIFESDPTISCIVDSSKDLFWINHQIKNLKKYKIQYQVVLVYKKPEILAQSFNKRSIFYKWRSHFMKFYKKIFFYSFNYIFISYESLIQNESSLKSLCSKLDIKYFEKKINYWHKEHLTLFGNNRARKPVEGLDLLGNERIEDLIDSGSTKKIDMNFGGGQLSRSQINKIRKDKVVNTIFNKLLNENRNSEIKYIYIQMYFLEKLYLSKRLIFSLKNFKFK